MSYSLRRYLELLLALVLAGSVAACSSTSTSSGASRATTTADEPVSEQQQEDVIEQSTDAMEVESAGASPEAEAQIQPPVVMELPEEGSDSATTGATERVEPVEGVAVFPENPYDIEDSTQADTAAEADTEIGRLRQELAATESELDRIREEESQADYSSSSDGSDSGTETDPASAGDDQQDYYSDRPDSASSSAGDTAQDGGDTAQGGAAAGSSRSGDSGVDLPGKPAEFSIYFGYDQAGFESRFEPIIVAHAEFLKANPDLRVEIQGNCDERGSREYNIALGQRRANAVKRALELLGVEGHRIDTVSFGSEKPIAFGRDEESWRLNRRADIVY
jgi:peptidoglycan-associated lipoprotein